MLFWRLANPSSANFLGNKNFTPDADENGFRKHQVYESLNHSTRVHHALASRAGDYTKKRFVFRLRCADGAQYLFQARFVAVRFGWLTRR